MKVFVIVVTYNGRKWYDRCIGSLQTSSVPMDIIVIDNASSDKSGEYIKEKFPDVRLIESKTNLGFAKANNIGIKIAIENGADYVFLLNQDAWIQPNTIHELVESCKKDDSIGIVSPMHLNGAGNRLDDFFTSYLPSDCVSDMFLNKNQPEYETTFVNAAAWLITKQCINKVGGFDTLLFRHYGEDNNYCQRVNYHGFKIIINTLVLINHDRNTKVGNRIAENEFSSFNDFRDVKIRYGNIQEQYDIDSIIKKIKKKYVLAIMTCRFKRSVSLKQQLKVYLTIQSSVIHNRKGGLLWLD